MPTAVITGPTSGIGLGFARALAAEGYRLVLVSRDRERLDAVAAEVEALHRIETEVVVADLADAGDTRRVEQRVGAGDVDLLINNAGFGLGKPFDVTTVEEEQRSIDVLITAVMRLSHAAIASMLERGHGDIINVSSVSGFLPRGTYGANKAWVTSFSSWAGLRYRDRGIRVMALCPGFVHTEFHQRMSADMSGIPSLLWLDADRVAREALADLRRGKTVSIPSRRYKAIVSVSRLIPRGAMERLARRAR